MSIVSSVVDIRYDKMVLSQFWAQKRHKRLHEHINVQYKKEFHCVYTLY